MHLRHRVSTILITREGFPSIRPPHSNRDLVQGMQDDTVDRQVSLSFHLPSHGRIWPALVAQFPRTGYPTTLVILNHWNRYSRLHMGKIKSPFRRSHNGGSGCGACVAALWTASWRQAKALARFDGLSCSANIARRRFTC